ncbi:hypothetical protein V5799_021276 [Amblyomma americanum]|uniref:Uncharacterized protein n=1 Tax=Amblyomma americanum TaxID=6943 RepID=A0AAQ4FQX9_AMBAM
MHAWRRDKESVSGHDGNAAKPACLLCSLQHVYVCLHASHAWLKKSGPRLLQPQASVLAAAHQKRQKRTSHAAGVQRG